MSDGNGSVNGNLAPLRNVSLFSALVQQVIERPLHLPGIGVFCGPAGLGKTSSAIYAANRHRAIYVAAKSSWTRKKLCQSVLHEMGIDPKVAVYDMVDQIAEGLLTLQRPLIIDEVDHLLRRADAIEVIRDIYESCNAPIILIGEEKIPSTLKRWERFHSRVLDWVRAEYCNLNDAKHLRRLYCDDLGIADDLLKVILDRSRGSARRICVNLERVKQTAKREGWKEVNADTWGRRDFYTGEAPTREGGR